MSIFRRAVSGLRKLILGRVRGDGGSQGVSLPSVGMRMEENNLTPTTRVVDGTIRYADTIPRNTIQTGDKYALTLNGTNEYGTGPVLSSAGLTNEMTVTFWLSPSSITAPADYGHIIGSWHHLINTNRSWIIDINGVGGGIIGFYVSADGTNANFSSSVSSIAVALNTWVHVAATFKDGTLKLYLDGEEVGVTGSTGTGAGASLYQGSNQIVLGASASKTGQYTHGSLDDIRVYGTTLLPAEIQALAASAPGDPPVETESLPLLHYKFEDAVTSTTITNNGVLENADLALTGNSVMNMRDQVGYLGFSDNTGFGDIRPLKPKYGLTLNGTNEYGTGPVVSGLTTQATWSVWVNTTALTSPGDYGVIIGVHDESTSDSQVAININGTDGGSGSVGFYVTRAGTFTNYAGVTSSPLSSGVWQHIAAVFDNGILHLYVDGVHQGPQTNVGTGVGTTLHATSLATRIGARSGSLRHYFDGMIDDVRVYDTALPESEIKALAAVKPGGTLPTTSATPLIHYTFEDPVSSPIVKNVGSLANADLTLTGVLANMRAQTGYVSFANSVGYGASFTTDGVNDHIDTGVTLNGATAFTVFKEVRYLSTNAYDLDGFYTTSVDAIRIGRDTGNNQVYATPGVAAVNLTPGTPIPNGEITTLSLQAAVGGNYNLRVNGTSVASGGSTMSAFTNTKNYLIGVSDSTTVTHHSHAEHTRYLIASRVLTSDELTWLDSGGTYGTPIDFLNDPDILVYYDFEDEHPDFVYNRANPSLPGIIVGGEWSTVPRSSVDTNKDVQQAGSSYRSAILNATNGSCVLASVLVGATADFDISADVYVTAYPAIQEGIVAQYSIGQAGRFWVSLDSAGAVSFFVNGTPTSVLVTTSAGAVALGKWHTVRATRVGDLFSLYLDGMLIGTQTQSGISVYQTQTRLLSSNTGTTFPSGAMISNVTINGTSYLTRPDETITGASLGNASYVNVVRGRPGTLTHTGIVPRDRVLTNRAVALNGTSEYIKLPDIADVDMQVEAWDVQFSINTADATGTPDVFVGFGSSVDNNRYLVVEKPTSGAGTIQVRLQAANATNRLTLVGTVNVCDGKNHVVRVTHDGAQTVSIYVDDRLDVSGIFSIQSHTIVDQVNLGALKRISAALTNFAATSIWDVDITLGGEVYGKWPCSEPSGTICYDVSGNNNHGTGAPPTRTGTQNLIDTHMTDGYSVATWFDGASDSFSRPTLVGGATKLCIFDRIWVDSLSAIRIVCAEFVSTGDNRAFQLYISTSGKLVLTVNQLGTSGNGKVWTSDNSLAVGQIYDISVTFDAGTVVMEVNGTNWTYTTSGGGSPVSLYAGSGTFEIGSHDGGLLPFAGTQSQLLIHKDPTAVWSTATKATIRAAGKPSEIAAIVENLGGTAWYFPDAKTEVLQGLPALTVNGAPEQRVIPAGVGLPPISYGPGVLAPGQSLDLYCGEDDAPYSIGLSDHLVDGDYDFGDGSEGDILFVSGADNHEKLVLLDDATDYPELFE